MSSVKDLLRGDVIDGSGTANYISKWSDSDTITNSVIYESSGNIGIGTTSASGSSGYTNLALNNTTGSEISLKAADSTKGYVYANNNIMVIDGTAGTLAFQTSSVERMRIDSSGNVGIGTTSPTHKLYVKGGNNNSLFIDNDGSSYTSLNIGFNGTQKASIVRDNRVGFERLYMQSDEGQLTFFSNTETIFGTGSGFPERMRITSGGDVLFGVTSTANLTGSTGGTGILPQSNGRNAIFMATTSTAELIHLLFRNPNGDVGSIRTSGSSTSYNTSSDYRLKENVVPMEGALDRVSQLQPSRFNFIADPETTVDGFLAHQVQEVVPEAITGTKDEVEEYEVTPAVLDDEGNVIEEAVMGTRPVYQGIDQSKLVPLLVGAIQELKAEIELLKSK